MVVLSLITGYKVKKTEMQIGTGDSSEGASLMEDSLCCRLCNYPARVINLFKTENESSPSGDVPTYFGCMGCRCTNVSVFFCVGICFMSTVAFYYVVCGRFPPDSLMRNIIS